MLRDDYSLRRLLMLKRLDVCVHDVACDSEGDIYDVMIGKRMLLDKHTEILMSDMMTATRHDGMCTW